MNTHMVSNKRLTFISERPRLVTLSPSLFWSTHLQIQVDQAQSVLLVRTTLCVSFGLQITDHQHQIDHRLTQTQTPKTVIFLL